MMAKGQEVMVQDGMEILNRVWCGVSGQIKEINPRMEVTALRGTIQEKKRNTI